MAEQKDTLAELQYYDIDGNPCSLDVLCRREPAWAANRLREADRLLAQGRDVALAQNAAIEWMQARVLKLLDAVEAAKRYHFTMCGSHEHAEAFVELGDALATLEGDEGLGGR